MRKPSQYPHWPYATKRERILLTVLVSLKPVLWAGTWLMTSWKGK